MDVTKPKTLTFMSLLIIVSFIILGVLKIWIGVFAILLQHMARGLYRPVTRKYMNKHIPTDKRAINIFTTYHIIIAVLIIAMTYMATKYMDKRLGVKDVNKRKIINEIN